MNLIESIREHEGFSGTVYQDHLGYDTIGYGTKMPLTKEECSIILRHRLNDKIDELHSRLDWLIEQPDSVQEILYEMAYQMGVSGVLRFTNTLKLIREKEYELASSEMLNSRWAKQTPNRANALAVKMRNA